MKPKQAKLEHLRTSDLVEVAYFLSKGYKLTDCEVEAVPYVTFTIQGQVLAKESEQLQKGETRVEPLKFREELSFIQDILLTALEKFNRKQREQREQKE